MTIYVSGDSEETKRPLLGFDFGVDAEHLVWWFDSHWVHDTRISSSNNSGNFLVSSGNLNADQYISDPLRPGIVAYLRGQIQFSKKIMQYHMLLVVFLTIIDIEGIWLLPSLTRFLNLWHIENTWSGVVEGLARHSNPANTADEVWLRLQTASNELPLSLV